MGPFERKGGTLTAGRDGRGGFVSVCAQDLVILASARASCGDKDFQGNIATL